MSWSACPLQQIEAQPCLSSNSRIAATILDPLVWTAAFILAGKMSNLLPSPPAMSLCLHRNASPQGAWWQSSKSLYLPIFSDEMAGNTQVCLCCTTIPDISCQCGGALGFLNGLLHLFKYNTFSSAETHTVYTVQQTLNISYIIAAILCFNQDRIMDQQSEIFSSWTVSYQIQMWCTQCTNWLMQWWRSLAGEYTSAFLRSVMHGCITGFDIKQHICQEKE